MVELRSVTVRFGPRCALRDLNLTVPQGGSLALWGANGAGKSTTFHAMLGLVPFEGQIRLCGLDAAREGAAARRMVGWAPQDLPADWTPVARTVAFLAELRKAKIASPAEYLAPFGLAGSADQPVAALSGGQRKRLSLALALLGDPPVLLLDEPTANLDPAARQQMLRLLQGLRKQGKTLMMASHRLGDVIRLCDQVAVMADGVLQRLVPAAGIVRRKVSTSVHAARRGKDGSSCAGG